MSAWVGEAGMLIILAWLSLRVSVTLAALVTVGLLPVALSKIRRSPEFALMTLAMLGMLWRGEAWKTVCLAEEAQLSQEPQPPPKTGSFYQDRSLRYADARCAILSGVIQFPSVAAQSEQHMVQVPLGKTPSDLTALLNDSGSTLATSLTKDLTAYPALYRALFSHIDFDRKSPLKQPYEQVPRVACPRSVNEAQWNWGFTFQNP